MDNNHQVLSSSPLPTIVSIGNPDGSPSKIHTTIRDTVINPQTYHANNDNSARNQASPNSEPQHSPGFMWIGETVISDTIGNDPGLCAFLLTAISVILIVCTLPFSLFFCVKVSPTSEASNFYPASFDSKYYYPSNSGLDTFIIISRSLLIY